MKTITAAELACPCCHLQVATPRLIHALNQLQELLQLEIIIHSADRCPNHNRTVGGTPGSSHLTGMAADLSAPQRTPLELYLTAEQIPAISGGGIGLYPGNFIHIDVRNWRARWFRVAGKDHPITEYLTRAHAT